MHWLFICIFLLLRAVDIESLRSSSSSAKEGGKQKDICPSRFENCHEEDCSDPKEEKYIVCFFTNWAWYRKGQAKFRPENINASLCTHIIYAFSSLDASSLLMTPYDTWADIDNDFYNLVLALKEKGLKILLSIGGWNDSAGQKWSNLINNATARTNFVSGVITFFKKYNFDGIDMDYEYPACPQGDATAGNSNLKGMFNQLVRELKSKLTGKLVTASTAGGKSLIENCYNLEELCQLVDWVNIMTYDYHSYSDGETGAIAPFCGSGSSWGVVDTINYYRKKLKCPAKKMVLGIPFYAKTYTLADSSKPEFGTAVVGAGSAGTFTTEPGTISYYEAVDNIFYQICYGIYSELVFPEAKFIRTEQFESLEELFKKAFKMTVAMPILVKEINHLEICLKQNDGWTTGYNRVNGSYIYKDKQFASFDGNTSMIIKSCMIKKYHLRGAVIYALDYDDFNDMCGLGSYPLLKTLNQHLCRNAVSYDN